jgi:hypothetical protein
MELTIIKRRQTREHLVQQYAKRPPVDTHVGRDVREPLGAKILGCSAERVRLVLGRHVDLAHAEIAQSQVVRHIEFVVFHRDQSLLYNKRNERREEKTRWDAQDILQLHIPICDVQLV